MAGLYGTLTQGADGTFSYAVSNSSTTVEALRTSANTLTDKFTYEVTDSTGLKATTTITITVQGANDAPVAAADYNTTKESLDGTAAAYTASDLIGSKATGNVLTNDTDKDSGDTKTVQGLAGAATVTSTNTRGLTDGAPHKNDAMNFVAEYVFVFGSNF